eukprot:CAMPEP_0182927876 /NCGR_PEP_ID=MMETSP0105_2-20130417/14520_1 /TAXON_ID=81532 ORGANISM="Acanthoeca-like sp., Strain 10tr" /NCGR_SAMPLE_ID=MMETSP0105_2 /ASSEMBLY_ACC=CAM_ASM_000205 /LENGTH=49 /DNA_ID=CAMNT_0025065849 /DNA_START=39 /DNA_END=188 /DNA_ORIENTATION=+
MELRGIIVNHVKKNIVISGVLGTIGAVAWYKVVVQHQIGQIEEYKRKNL